MSFQYTVYNLYADIKTRSVYNKAKNDYFKSLSKNFEKLPLELINVIKTFIGSYDEETEQVYLNNGLVKIQLMPIYSSYYCSTSYKNNYNYNYNCIMEVNYDKNENLILSHRMNSKQTQNRYYIGKYSKITRCDDCGQQPRCRNNWYCLGITETVDYYQTNYVCENLDISIMMFWSILNEIKNKK